MLSTVPLAELGQSRAQRAITRRLMRLFHASSRRPMAEVDTPKGSGNPGTLRAFELALCLGGAAGPAAFAHDHGLELFQLDEIVGLPAQLVGHHGRLRADGRADRNPAAPALHGFDQFAEVAITRANHDMVDPL